MITGKKGLSTVVTTLIIVLLVLAAIGIIWGPIKNLLSSSTNSLDQTKCLSLDLQVTKVNNTGLPANNYAVTLKRGDSGSNTEQAGAKLIFYSDSGNSQTLDFIDDAQGTPAPTLFEALEVQTATFNAGIVANNVEVTPYYLNVNGEKMICTTSTSLDFDL